MPSRLLLLLEARGNDRTCDPECEHRDGNLCPRPFGVALRLAASVTDARFPVYLRCPACLSASRAAVELVAKAMAERTCGRCRRWQDAKGVSGNGWCDARDIWTQRDIGCGRFEAREAMAAKESK